MGEAGNLSCKDRLLRLEHGFVRWRRPGPPPDVPLEKRCAEEEGPEKLDELSGRMREEEKWGNLPFISVPVLRAKDYRICSEHFEKDDYTDSTQRGRLKKNAIPWTKTRATTVEETDTTGVPLNESLLAGVPQSTPKKTLQRESESRSSRPGLSSCLTLLLSSPETSSVRPRTKPSLSGTYIAKPLSWRQSVVSLAMIKAFHKFPNTFAITKVCSPSSHTPTSSSGSGSGSGKEPEHERKWIVNESRLLELFNTCKTCGSAVENKRIVTHGSQIRVLWTCLNDHPGSWASCPDIRGMAENNLLISASTFFTGTTHTTISDWAELLHTPIPKKTQYYSMQSIYLIPVIQQAYRDQHEKFMERLVQLSASGHKVELCGDARSDSPGFSSKYCTYSFQDDATKEIIHFELVQVTETTSSVAMEVLGFQRGLDYLLDRGVVVGVVTTDRSPSVRKLMKDNYTGIQHEFDPWHVSKSVKKKLVLISNKKNNKDLQPWIKSITNHLYWSCSTSKGDKEDCVRRWKSLLHHICGIHRWEEDGAQYTCHHTTLTEDEQRRKRWLRPDSSAFVALKGVVLDKNLVRDLRQMSLFKHTGSLEVYHQVMLKYAEKRLHFSYDSMRARTQLAVIDHNSNVGRPQDDHGIKLYTQDRVSNGLQNPCLKTPQAFRHDLVERVLRRRDDSTVVFSDTLPPRKPGQRTLLQNIAPVPRPDKGDLVAHTKSRF
ncbi:unnamed protein product [Leuciscus chuanchicus]